MPSQSQPEPLDSKLRAQIFEAPDDLEARAVYSDWLADRGDPRGELISLQLSELRGTATGKDKARARKLIKAHLRTWLGPLGEVFRHLELRGGFLDRAELGPAGLAPHSTWVRAAQSLELSTLRTLDLGEGTAANYARFLFSPQLHALRKATIPNLDVLTTLLGGSPRPWQHLGLRRIPFARDVAAAQWKVLLPQLHTVDVDLPLLPAGHDWALDRLRHNGMIATVRTLRLFLETPPHEEEVSPRAVVDRLLLPGDLEAVELRRDRVSLRLEKKGRRILARLVDVSGQLAMGLLQRLPRLDALEVRLPEALAANVEQLAPLAELAAPDPKLHFEPREALTRYLTP